jgi:hypothetical protein
MHKTKKLNMPFFLNLKHDFIVINSEDDMNDQ